MATASWDTIEDASRIQIFGVTGVGKTTAARKLAALKNAIAIDLDDINWADPSSLGPWRERSADEAWHLIGVAVQSERFVISGNYNKFRPIIEPRLDAAIFLNYPPVFSFFRLLKRTARRIITKEKVCNGNTESLRKTLSNDSILLWWWKTYRKRQRTMAVRIADPLDIPILEITSHKQLTLLFDYLARS